MTKLFLGLFFTISAVAAPWESVHKKGLLRLATEGAYPPFNYFEGKALKGFEVEIGEAVAAKVGLKFEWKTLPFDSLLIGLGQDRYDMVIASHGVTEERAKAVEFTAPHYCTGGVVVSLAGGPKTGADLSGKKVAVQVGTTYLTAAQKIPGVKEVKTYPKDTDALQNLLGKRVDAWVTDKFVALEAFKKHKGAALQMGDLLFQEKVAMAVSKGNSSLVAELNKALAAIKKDGDYAKISQKYFGQDVGCN